MKAVFLYTFLVFFSCRSQTTEIISSQINGVNFVSSNDDMDSSHILPIVEVNSNWASIIPFAFMASKNEPNIVINGEYQWKGERTEGVTELVHLMHKNGLSVMIKPQIWVSHGAYTGIIEMSNKKDWEKLEVDYRKYILTFVEVAEKEGVELFCIGTELKKFIANRPKFWKQLIIEIREIYSGKLTYAGNWDAFMHIPFWEELDYIGVDAYFPVSDIEEPTVQELSYGWSKNERMLDSISAVYNKDILFTEYGYRSITGCAKTPWDYDLRGVVNQDAQVNALTALYDVFWGKDYFAGGFLWKWYPNHKDAGGSKNKMFTVQNKKAENLVRLIYGN